MRRPALFRPARSCALVLVLAIIGLSGSHAMADNPVARHDSARTGMATGLSNITDPTPYWRYYLGGALSGGGLLIEDLDQNGEADVVYVTGGRLVAARSNGQFLWSSEPRDFAGLVGVADLDGDMDLELVVRSRTNVYAVDAATGAIDWVEPDGEMGTVGGVRLADVSGDMLPDIIITECGCCGVNSGNPGVVYSFGAGFTQTPLYSLPFSRCGNNRALTIVDADGDGTNEILIPDNRTLALVDGETGAVLATSPDLVDRTPLFNCVPTNLDGMPGDELVCLLNSSLVSADNLRRVAAFRYNPGMGTLDVLYDNPVAPVGGNMSWVDPVVDLNGDGQFELVYSTRDTSAGQWSTHVANAATGVVYDTEVDDLVQGTAPVGAGGSLRLFTVRDTGMRGFSFDGAALQFELEILDRAPLGYPDRDQLAVQNIFNTLIHADFNNDGVDDLLTRRVGADSAIFVYDLSTGVPSIVVSFDYPARFEPLQHWLIPPLNRPYPQIAVARNDGYLTVFDDQLVPIDIGADGGIPGIRIGGYYAAGGWRDLTRAPRVAALGPLANESIVVRDSRGALLRLDADQATLNVLPEKVWERTNIISAGISPMLLGGSPGIAVTAYNEPVTTPPTYRLQVLNPDTGVATWSQPLAPGPLNDIVFGNFNSDMVPDIALQWGDPGDTLLRTQAFDGVNGASLWNAAAFEAGCGRQPAGISVHDINGDMIDDVLVAGAGSRALDGNDGNQLLAGTGGCYGILIPWNIDGDAELEILHTASNVTLRAFESDFSASLWTSTDDDRPYPYAAVAQCMGNDVLVSTAWQNLARVKFTNLSNGTHTSAVLADGQRFVDEADANMAGAFLGQLSSVAVHSDLSGTGDPVAVIGSPGGWLYGINPCDGTMVFAVDFGVAVGEAVFGDVDGDGYDEILVTAADGYLYGLRHNAIPAPSNVADTDGAGSTTDIDVITTMDTLYASWDPVMGATGYEVAVIDAAGQFVTSQPIWRAEAGTQSTLNGLPLQDMALYRVLVRAIGATGTSPDATSDGVFVRFPAVMMDPGPMDMADMAMGDVTDTTPPADMAMDTGTDTTPTDVGGDGGADSGDAVADGGSGGSDAGCGCQVRQTQHPSPWGIALALVALVFGVRRRRR